MNSCEMLSSCQALNKLSVIVSYFTQDKQLVKEKKITGLDQDRIR